MRYIIVFLFFGAVGGVLVSYIFWFDDAEKVFFRMILENGLPPWDFLVQTATFKKLSISFFAIGIIALIVEEILESK